MPPLNPHRKWLLASAAFSVAGVLVIVLLLWSAWRGRSAANGPPGVTREVEVQFQAGGNTLAGVLVLPVSPGPYPAVVFLNGSGAADRTGNKAFPHVWAQLARRGFACLSWDRPGVGKSSGDFEAQSFDDRAREALAAVQFLRSRPEIRPDRIGLWGFSQGGAVAPLAASLTGDLAFVIVVSGSQVPAWEQDLYRVEAELRADGHSDKVVAEALEIARLRMELMRKGGVFEELDEAQKSCVGRPWFEYVQYCERKRFESGKLQVGFDPGPYWEKVRCPVLGLFGDKDTSTAVEASVAVMRKGLEGAGNKDLTIKIFPKANHSLAPSDTGGRKEARERAKTRATGDDPEFVPGYPDTASAWLEERFGARR
jgi:pimeloyl-ACP methyl ester carboxylesterase